jgi:hypothetical protein
MNSWGILATSSSSCHSGGAQMEAMRDTAWVLTHALVNMTNACLSSSFLRTDRAFGSRFGPVAKWPFCIQTRFRKDPRFRHFCLVAKSGCFSPHQDEETREELKRVKIITEKKNKQTKIITEKF